MQIQLTTSKEIEKEKRALEKQERALQTAKVQYVNKQTDGITGALQTAQDSLHDVYSDYQYHSLDLDQKIQLLIKIDGFVGRVALVTAWQLGHELIDKKHITANFVAYIIEDLEWDYRRAARYMQIAKAFNDRDQLEKAIRIGITTVSAAVEAARVIKKMRAKIKGIGKQTTLDIKAFEIEYRKSQLDPAEYEITDNKQEITSYTTQTKTAQTPTTENTATTATTAETAETPTADATAPADATATAETVEQSIPTTKVVATLIQLRTILTDDLPTAEGSKDDNLEDWQAARTVALDCIALLKQFVTLTTISKDHSNADVPRSIDMDTSGMDSLDDAK